MYRTQIPVHQSALRSFREAGGVEVRAHLVATRGPSYRERPDTRQRRGAARTLAPMNHDHADLSDHPRNAEEERERIARHIERAERAAHTRDLRGLTSLQQIVRALLLEELARYRSDGRFPQNRDFAARTPYFVDADGTRCAVAHLLDVGGEATLVDRIARERNNALVADLADEPRLLAWLAAAGLTVEEAALIQPGYCSPLWTTVCGDGLEYQPPYAVPASGVLRAVVIEANLERPSARVDEIHGTAPGVAVGDVLPVGALAPYDTQPIVGMTLLLPVSPGDGGVVVPSGYGGRFPGVALASNGTYTPHVNGVAVPTLSRAQFERAVMSSTCRDLVRGYDPAWSESTCPPEGCSCGAAPGSRTDAPSTLGVLLALVSAIVARRTSRVSPRAGA